MPTQTHVDPTRLRIRARIRNADWGNLESDGLEHLKRESLIGGPLHKDTSEQLMAYFLRDIALSLRQIVIELDGIRENMKEKEK